MMKIFLPGETLSAIKRVHIFVDTCILLDFASFTNRNDKLEFLNKLALFKRNGCVFVTIDPAAVEYFLGSTLQDLSIKKEYFNQLIKVSLSIQTLNKEIIESLIIEYEDMDEKMFPMLISVWDAP